jgi:hypothetical protein
MTEDPKKDLQHERQRCSFSIQELKEAIAGGPEVLKQR